MLSPSHVRYITLPLYYVEGAPEGGQDTSLYTRGEGIYFNERTGYRLVLNDCPVVYLGMHLGSFHAIT